MLLNPELPPVQGRFPDCPPMNRGAKIFFALGVISLIGGVLATCYALQFLTASHWLFYTGCGVVVLSFVAFSLTAICARFFGQQATTPHIRLEPDDFMALQQGPRSYTINDNTIRITLSQNELRSDPESHLNSLAEQIERHVMTSEVPRVHVKFNGQEGRDVGGLTAIYFNDLISGIVSQEHLFKQLEDSSYYLPNPERNQNLRVFEQLGKAMMYCYPNFVIGNHFDDSLFAIIFNFSNNELTGRFDSLPNERKVELYRILLDNIGEEVFPANRRMLDYLVRDVDEWSDEELDEVIAFVDSRGQVPLNLLEDDEPNINLIKSNKKNKKRIKDALFTVAALLYDSQIRGIHAIAKGMRSVCHKGVRNPNKDDAWQMLLCQTTHKVFNENLQGSINREFIIGKIFTEHLDRQPVHLKEVINQKVDWLKQWIRNEGTSDSDIKDFLKYVTGSTCLPKNLEKSNPKGKITVKWQSEVETRSHHPRASTCFNILYLSPEYHMVAGQGVDETQEGFILCLKEASKIAGGYVLRN